MQVDLHVSAAGTVSWVLCDSSRSSCPNDFLTQQKAAGLLVRAKQSHQDRVLARTDVSTAVKQAMDPASKFLPSFTLEDNCMLHEIDPKSMDLWGR